MEILVELTDRRYVSPSQSDIVREIITLANAAAHGRRIAADDAARLKDAAHSVARTITTNASQAFHEDVGRVLASDSLVEDLSLYGGGGSDYSVLTENGLIYVEVKFWTKMRRGGEWPLFTPREWSVAAANALYLVVPNITVDEEALPSLRGVFTISQLHALIATGELARLD